MVNSVDIPLIVDGDDGYGGALSAYRTTQEIIRVGAAGMFIDDQKHPTKGPSWGIQEVLPRDEYLGKLGAVLEARDREDKDFVICARTDAAPVLGAEEMLARVKASIELGVDMVLPQSIESIVPKSREGAKEAFRKYYKAMGAPRRANLGIRTILVCRKRLCRNWRQVMGTWESNSGCFKTLIDLYKGLYDTGTLNGFSPPGTPSNNDLFRIEGVKFWDELEKKYVIIKG